MPYLAFGVTQVLLGAVPVTAVVAALVGFVLGGSITMWNVVTVTIRQRLIEPARFGRVNSVYRWIGTGAGEHSALSSGVSWRTERTFVCRTRGRRHHPRPGALFAPALLRGTHEIDLADQACDLTPAPPSMT